MSKRPTYTDKEATGGDINTRGLENQKAYMLANLPRWLAHSAFSAVTYELVGDIEVKYFNPKTGELIDFYQVKDYVLSPAQLREIVRDFQSKASEAPFRHFYIVCSGLSAKASPIGTILDRIRRQAPTDAAAFYPTGTPIDESTINEFIERVITAGGTQEEAQFMLENVSIDFQHRLNESNAEAVFNQALTKYYTEASNLTGHQLQEIYPRMRALIEGRRSQPSARPQLLDVFTDSGNLRFSSLEQVEIHTLCDGTPYRGNAVVLPWQAFFGGRERNYAKSEQWNSELLSHLARLRAWLEETSHSKTLLITGKRRLSANMALGWAFPAVADYTLIHEDRGMLWRTSENPHPNTPEYVFTSAFQQGEGENLVVSIGIIHHISEEVCHAAKSLGLSAAPHLDLHSPEALISADQINLAVQNVKMNLSHALRATKAQNIHLFLASPATFALFLGHRLNGVTSVQCYERRDVARYEPTCRLGAA